LQERKLITRSANQGPRVVMPTVEALAELFVVREALEGMAALNATDAEIAQLRAMVTVPGSWPDGETVLTKSSTRISMALSHNAAATQC
jgi:hypothetical protein